MIFGLRLLLLLALFGIGISFAAYLFTKNPRFYYFAKTIAKLTAGFIVIGAVLYLLERLFFR